MALSSIVQQDKRRLADDVKERRVSDVLSLILPCNAVLHVAYPIHR